MQTRSIEELPKLVAKYRGYIEDPEGNAVELLHMFLIRDAIEALLTDARQSKSISSELHREIKELDDTLWHQRPLFLEVITPMLLQNARRKRRFPRDAWWWYLDELVADKASRSGKRKRSREKVMV
jgi:hypothetical protein